MRELISELKGAWRTGKLEFPMGKPWFRVTGRAVEPVTSEGWFAFYAIFTWVIGATYYAFTGRDPVGLPLGALLPVLGLASLVLFVVGCAICVLKTDFPRHRE